LFADTTRGANASTTCYSLIETAKANHLEPYAYVLHVLNHIGAADTLEKIEALLPLQCTAGYYTEVGADLRSVTYYIGHEAML